MDAQVSRIASWGENVYLIPHAALSEIIFESALLVGFERHDAMTQRLSCVLYAQGAGWFGIAVLRDDATLPVSFRQLASGDDRN
jgi:hypothetical protein